MQKFPEKEKSSLQDPDVFMALDDLELVAKGVVEGALSGLHRSKFIGFSNEFDSHRDYQLGDDLKHLNWNLWGKTDKLFIKQYESDTNLSLYIFLDQSGSMLTNNGKGSKWAYAARAVASLCYLAMKNRDATGVYLLENSIKNFIPPAVKMGHFYDVVSLLQKSNVKGSFEITETIESIVPLCNRRGIVVLFSDLFDNEEELLKKMEYFKMSGHEVIIFQILDPLELDLPEKGEYEFVDLETGKTIKADVEDLRETYKNTVNKWREGLKKRCKNMGIDWVPMTTDTPLKDVIIEYLLKRIIHY